MTREDGARLAPGSLVSWFPNGDRLTKPRNAVVQRRNESNGSLLIRIEYGDKTHTTRTVQASELEMRSSVPA